MVTNCIKTTLVIVQRDQAYTLGYIIIARSAYCGRKAEIYTYAHHVKICEQPSRLLKLSCEACLKKAMKNPLETDPQSYVPISDTTLIANSSLSCCQIGNYR